MRAYRTDAPATAPQRSSRAARDRHPAAHLWWAVPLGLVGAAVAAGLAAFDRCGIAGCTTPERGGDGTLAVLALVTGVCLAAPFWFVPWTRRAIVRLCVGAGLMIATTVALFLQVRSL